MKGVTESSPAKDSQLVFVKDFGLFYRVSERAGLFRVVQPQALETQGGERDESQGDKVHGKVPHQVDREFRVEFEQGAREHVPSPAQSGLATISLAALRLARGVGKALSSQLQAAFDDGAGRQSLPFLPLPLLKDGEKLQSLVDPFGRRVLVFLEQGRDVFKVCFFRLQADDVHLIDCFQSDSAATLALPLKDVVGQIHFERVQTLVALSKRDDLEPVAEGLQIRVVPGHCASLFLFRLFEQRLQYFLLVVQQN